MGTVDMMTKLDWLRWAVDNAYRAAKYYVRGGKERDRADFCTHVRRVFTWPIQWHRYGFCEAELWNLQDETAAFLAPRLRMFAEWFGGRSTPMNIQTSAQWVDAVNTMAETFHLISTEFDDSDFGAIDWQERTAKIQHGLDLFREYYLDLWD